MKDSKQMEAAVTAVINFLKEEEADKQAASGAVNRWAVSARQSQMQTREQLQKKAFYGWKNR